MKIINCKQCNKETTNPKFCSRSCAASYTNRLFPKRKKSQLFCKSCGIIIFPNKYETMCDSCNPFKKDWSKITLASLQNRRSYQRNSQIRDLARQVINRQNIEKKCKICGYDKHVDVCHIKPISAFSLDDTISKINSSDNLILLCKNHHWELDHKLLSL
jgi:predicted restriction endonuclease